ncbi:hypothetical protein AB0H76_03875 [Nocardia sp. NPDC050712]|uniref:hypothetical protein n=1 Tax=Nocardia sp. NPDC050712 TaxID=3155518 RepID=UPI003411800F
MGNKNGKSKSERLAEIEEWQTFRGEIDTWAFEEIEGRLLKLHSKVTETYDPPPNLDSVASDVRDVLSVVRRRRDRLRLREGQVAE